MRSMLLVICLIHASYAVVGLIYKHSDTSSIFNLREPKAIFQCDMFTLSNFSERSVIVQLFVNRKKLFISNNSTIKSSISLIFKLLLSRIYYYMFKCGLVYFAIIFNVLFLHG